MIKVGFQNSSHFGHTHIWTMVYCEYARNYACRILMSPKNCKITLNWSLRTKPFGCSNWRILRRTSAITTILTGSIFGVAQSPRLGPIKLASAEGDSKFAIRIRDGISSYRERNIAESRLAFDEASLIDLESGLPWLNGGILLANDQQWARAHSALENGWMFGEYSARWNSVSSEVNVARGQIQVGLEELKLAEFLGPDDPYVNLSRSKLEKSRGRHLDAERAMWQSFRGGRNVVLDGKFDKHYKELLVSGPLRHMVGVDGTLQGALTNSDVSLEIKLGSRMHDGDPDTEQRDVNVNASVGIGSGVFGYLRSSSISSREGGESLISLPPTPGASAKLKYESIGYLWNQGGFSTFFGFRESNVELSSASNAPYIRNNFQNQYIVESRLDHGPWSIGAAWSRTYRDAVSDPAAEPLGSIFANGETEVLQGYGLYKSNFGPNIKYLLGISATTVDNETNVDPAAEVAVRVIGAEFATLKYQPSFHKSASNLAPNNIARHSNIRNRGANPFDPNQQFREIEGEKALTSFNLPIFRSKSSAFSVEAEHNDMANYQISTVDPRLSASLGSVPVEDGWIDSVTLKGAHRFSKNAAVHAKVSANRSKAKYLFEPVGSNSTWMPGVPSSILEISFDFTVGDTSVALSSRWSGPQVIAQLEDEVQVPVSVITKVSSRSEFNIVADHYINSSSSLKVVALNIFNSKRFPGFAGDRVLSIQYGMRF